MNKKFKFELGGELFELPRKHLKEFDWYGKKLPKPIIEMNRTATAAVIKQYVKKKYPNVVVNATSESFANGNSVNIYLSDNVGRAIDPAIVSDVRNFGINFVYGKFNGMNDIYEYHSNELTTDYGTEIKPGTKYLSVDNQPKFCTVPDICKMLREMTTTDNYASGRMSLEKAIKAVKGYGATENNINKAIKLIY
jgi:hypothetical protein